MLKSPPLLQVCVFVAKKKRLTGDTYEQIMNRRRAKEKWKILLFAQRSIAAAFRQTNPPPSFPDSKTRDAPIKKAKTYKATVEHKFENPAKTQNVQITQNHGAID